MQHPNIDSGTRLSLQIHTQKINTTQQLATIIQSADKKHLLATQTEQIARGNKHMVQYLPHSLTKNLVYLKYFSD
jgi:ubiquitin-protein ligase